MANLWKFMGIRKKTELEPRLRDSLVNARALLKCVICREHLCPISNNSRPLITRARAQVTTSCYRDSDKKLKNRMYMLDLYKSIAASYFHWSSREQTPVRWFAAAAAAACVPREHGRWIGGQCTADHTPTRCCWSTRSTLLYSRLCKASHASMIFIRRVPRGSPENVQDVPGSTFQIVNLRLSLEFEWSFWVEIFRWMDRETFGNDWIFEDFLTCRPRTRSTRRDRIKMVRTKFIECAIFYKKVPDDNSLSLIIKPRDRIQRRCFIKNLGLGRFFQPPRRI